MKGEGGRGGERGREEGSRLEGNASYNQLERILGYPFKVSSLDVVVVNTRIGK